MKKQTPEERLKEVTAQLTFLEEQNRTNPDRKLNKTITQLKAIRGTLEAIID